MTIDEIKSHVNSRPREYLESKHGIVIKNKEHSSCPICKGGEKTTKLSIWDNNRIHCFTCGLHEDVLGLIAIDNNKDIKKEFREVIELACKEFGLALDDKKGACKEKTREKSAVPTVSNKMDLVQRDTYQAPQHYDFTDIILQAHEEVAKTDYFTKRGFSDELIRKYKLGFSLTGYNALFSKYPELKNGLHQARHYQYVIPVLNQDDTCNYFMVRATDGLASDSKNGKMCKILNMKNPNKRNPVRLFNDRYIINHDKYQIDTLFIVEGWADALSLEEIGYHAIALNSTSNARKFINLCRTYDPNYDFLVSLDSDESGQKTQKFLSRELVKMGFNVGIGEISGNHKDANDFLLQDKESFVKEVALALTKNKDYLEGYAEENVTHFVNAPIQLKCGSWECSSAGIRMCVDPIQNKWIRASFQQILPVGIIENIETGEQKYMISFSQWRNRSYVWKTITVSPVICSSARQIINLASLGVSVTDITAKHLVSYIADLYQLNQGVIPIYRAISHMGWVGKEFYPYESSIIFDGDNEQSKIVESVKEYGNFDVWAKECMTFRGNLAVRLLIDTSLASVLISKIGGLCFVVHLRGTSNSGKTVALIVSASVWGMPDKLMMSVDSTINYCTNRAAFLKNLPVLVDETQLAKGSLDKLIYSLSEGKTRGRLDRSSKEKDGKSWECISVFTGEVPIVSNQSGAGAINRVIEIETEGELFQDFSRVLDVVRSNYGHAGKKFVRYIQEADSKTLLEEYRLICKELDGKTNSTGKQIQSLAFIVLADRIAQKCIFHNEKPLNLEKASKLLKIEKEISQSERAYQFVVNWVALNENFFTEDSPKIFGRITKEFCLINQNALASIMTENNFDFESVKKEWAIKNYLERNSQGKYYFQTTVGSKETKANYVKLLFPEGKCFEEFKDVVVTQEELPYNEMKDNVRM